VARDAAEQRPLHRANPSVGFRRVPSERWDTVPAVGPQVTLLYRRQTPSHYVARFGTGGWCEGWGWTADEALTDLARTASDTLPLGIPSAALEDRDALVAWLRVRSGVPVLDDTTH
jgi:hypothetical protein